MSLFKHISPWSPPADYSPEINHLIYGNIYGPGQMVIAATADALAWENYVINHMRFGDINLQPDRWRNRVEVGLYGYAAFKLPDGGVLASLHRAAEGDRRGSYFYQWAFLDATMATDLAGNWEPVLRLLQHDENELRTQYIDSRRKANPLQPSITSRAALTAFEQSLRDFFDYFPNREARFLAGQLITLGLQDSGACTIRGVTDHDERLRIALALGALLPPAFRCQLSFATRVISLNDINVAIKFLDEDQLHESDYALDWSQLRFVGYAGSPDSKLHPFVSRLLDVAEGGYEKLRDFHLYWGERARALVIQCDEAMEAMALLSDWVMLDHTWTDNSNLNNLYQLAQLMQRDVTLKEEHRADFWQRIIIEMTRQHNHAMLEPLKQELSAAVERDHALLTPVLRQTLLQEAASQYGLQAHALTISLLEQRLISRDEWQSMPGKLITSYTAWLSQASEIKQCLDYLSASNWDHTAEWSRILKDLMRIAENDRFMLDGDSALKLFHTWSVRFDEGQFADPLTDHSGWLERLPDPLGKILGHSKLQPGLYAALRQFALGTIMSSEAETYLFALLNALGVEQTYHALIDKEAISLLIERSFQKDTNGKLAFSALQHMILCQCVKPHHLKYYLLVWHLRHINIEQDIRHPGAVWLLQELNRNDKEYGVPGLIKLLHDEKISLSVTVAFYKKAFGVDFDSVAWLLLRAYEFDQWQSTPNLPNHIIEHVLTRQESGLAQQVLATRERAHLLTWQINHFEQNQTQPLLEWWVKQFEHYLQQHGEIPQAVQMLYDARTVLNHAPRHIQNIYIVLLSRTLRQQPHSILIQLEIAMSSQELPEEHEYTTTSIARAELIPDGKFDTLIKQLQQLRQSIVFLQSLPMLNSDSPLETVLQEDLQKLTSEQRQIMLDSLEDVSEALYRLGKDYDKQDRKKKLLSNEVNTALEDGKTNPSTKLGMLRWLFGVVQRNTQQPMKNAPKQRRKTDEHKP